ncbi:MAG: heme o synthase [Halobacteriales archaeon]
MTRLTDILSLFKPRIVALLCLTGASAVFAAGGAPPLRTVAFVIAGASIAGGSAALNCYYDRHLDTRMKRTADRPLPAGRLDSRLALLFAALALAVGTAVGLLALPAISVGCMWLGVIAYVGLYTVGLKRNHPSGVVLGGSAGSFPVLAGWSVVEPIGPAALLMAALVFAWTPAHAWALAHVYRDDFAAAGVATLPAIAPRKHVQRAVWWSSLLTVALAGAIVPFAGSAYVGVALVGSICFLVAYRSYARAGTDGAAVRAFFTSNLYLAILFAGWAVDGSVGVPAWGVLPAAAVTAYAFHRMWAAHPSLDGVEGTSGGEWHPTKTARRALDEVVVRV